MEQSNIVTLTDTDSVIQLDQQLQRNPFILGNTVEVDLQSSRRKTK